MRRFRYAEKFGVIAILALVPFALVLLFFIVEVNRGVAFANQERIGVAYVRPVHTVLDDLLRLRGSQRAPSAGQVAPMFSRHIKDLDAAEARFGPLLDGETTGDYQLLRSLIGKDPDHFERKSCDQAIRHALALINQISLSSKLVLDPVTESYYSADAFLVQLQRVEVSLQEIRDAANPGGSAVANRQIIGSAVRLQVASEDLDSDLDKMVKSSPKLFVSMDPVRHDLQGVAEQVLSSVESNSPPLTAISDEASRGLEVTTNSFGLGITLLDTLLKDRSEEFAARRWRVVVITVACLLMALYLHLAVYGETVTELDRLTSGIEDLAGGIQTAAFEPGTSRDEIGRVTQVLSAMIETMRQEDHSRRALETQLREAQKMEAIGSLAAGIAHDFNNILHAIKGNLELAMTDIESGHPARLSLTEIEKASIRASEMVQQILSFSRHDLSQRQRVLLPELVGEIFRLLRSGVPTGIEFQTELSSETPAVLADATQLHQVLLNLCNNAWQSLDGRPGSVIVRTCRANLATRIESAGSVIEPGEYALIEVSDTGNGIPVDVQERVFEPFFTTKPRGRGTGLGLSVVLGIVKAHDGLVQLESFVGEGTTIRIYLPPTDVQEPTAAKSVQKSFHESASAGMRVLYVDDDDALVLLVERSLSRQGVAVSAFVNPEDALTAFKADPKAFSMVFTDYNMPSMPGIKFAQKVIAINPDVPVCLTSGFVTAEMATEAKAAGIRELIYKPSSIAALCDALIRHARTTSTG